MVYRSERGKTYKCRVVDRTLRAAVASTGCRDKAAAEDVERFVQGLRARRRWEALAAIVDYAKAPAAAKRAGTAPGIALAEAYDHELAGTLDEELKRRARAASDPDLAPLVAEWGGRGRRAHSDRYVRQVREMIPAGARFPASTFTRRTISRFLAGLEVADPTRNRYRAALAQFARWLVEREIIETNPVRDVAGFSEHEPRTVHYSPAQAQALIAALPQPFRALEALMCGTGMEWAAVNAATRRDVELDSRTVHARGGKTRYRTRYVEVTEAWCWPHIEAHVRTLTPGAKLFQVTEKQALAAHHEAVAALGLEPSKLHDWRHTYAITAILRRDDHQQIKHQLGHSPRSMLLYTTYGVYVKKADQAAKREARERAGTPEAATTSATTHRRVSR